MPRALAIETSGRIGSIAVIDGDEIRDEETFQHGLQNAAQIIPIIDRLTRAQHWSSGDIEEVYVSIGPGSFTGLRIGVTLAKTMALASGVKIVAVPTVRVLAENGPADAANLIIVLDAKRDQIFTARFGRREGKWIEEEPAHVDSLEQMLARSPRPVHLLGEGIPYHQKFIPDDRQIIVRPQESWRAGASVVAKLGTQMAQRGEFADPFKLTPIYIRRPEAEEKADQMKVANDQTRMTNE
jgi:tRNA threonylcarbamoyladenosine biosynthesis protein TsaB